MLGFILGAAVLTLCLWLTAKKQKMPPKAQKPKNLLDGLLTGGLAIVLLLVFRIGWVQALGRLQYLVWLLLPFLRQGSAEAAPPPSSASSSRMTHTEALHILGLEETATEMEIQRAYKQLMVKLHPDAGGNSYLAGKLNEARDCLIQERKQ